MKRGQAAVEYVVLLGVILVFLVPMIQISLIQTYSELRLAQLDNSFNRLAKSVDAVGALSLGSQEFVIITLPSGIEDPIGFRGTSIEVNVSIGGSKNLAGYQTQVSLDSSSSMPNSRGTYRVLVKKVDQQKVKVELWPST